MSKAIILQHVAHEGPGRIVPIFRDFGIPTEIRHLYRGDEVPTDLDELRVLVVLGGPMGVADLDDPKFPFLRKELSLLQRLVQHDRPVLGVCLGAQLLAHAAGAKVYPNTRPVPPAKPGEPAPPPGEALPEIGWAPVTFPFPGGTEPIVTGLVDQTPFFHWHFDTFDLPRLPAPSPLPPGPPPPTGNALLSSSKACKNQAFRFKSKLFGFQYHIESTRPDIEAMLSANAADLTRAGTDAATIRRDTEAHYPRFDRAGAKVLQNFVQFLRMY